MVISIDDVNMNETFLVPRICICEDGEEEGLDAIIIEGK